MKERKKYNDSLSTLQTSSFLSVLVLVFLVFSKTLYKQLNSSERSMRKAPHDHLHKEIYTIFKSYTVGIDEVCTIFESRTVI